MGSEIQMFLGARLGRRRERRSRRVNPAFGIRDGGVAGLQDGISHGVLRDCPVIDFRRTDRGAAALQIYA